MNYWFVLKMSPATRWRLCHGSGR